MSDRLVDPWGNPDVPFEESIRPHLPEKLREFVCDFDGSYDHGHTSCLFFGMAANEIERLRELLVGRADEILRLSDLLFTAGIGE